MMQKVVGNPIYNYQMLKRLLVYWKNMEESIKKIDTKGESNGPEHRTLSTCKVL